MTTAVAENPTQANLREVIAGLSSTPQKTLPPWLFYDQHGSELFEQITALPEYYLTRTERSILELNSEQIFLDLGKPVTVVELGAGTASKTGILLRAATRLQASVLYQPIDVSASALQTACAALSDIPHLTIHPRTANYVTETFSLQRPAGHRILTLYIGSSIGNFSPSEALSILRNLRSHLEPGDALLLGVDLAPSPSKPVSTILSAYDDAAGVTAAFNKNILVRLNRELDANFNLDCFAHRVRWNPSASRIEMHLESLAGQTVIFPAEERTDRIHFAAGETIHTENSYKFTPNALTSLITGSGFATMRIFHDPAQSFAVNLAVAV